MKKTLLVLGCLFFAGSVQAQWGVTVGFNYGQFTSSTRHSFQTFRSAGKVGYQVSAFYERKITDRLSILPEVQLHQQRATVDTHDYQEGYQATYQVNLTYVSMPLALRTYLGKVYLDLGSQAGGLLRA